MRIGHGYDVHRVVEGRKLIIGGVLIEHSLGLLGHSDADVLLHAVMDSLLGAAGLGDIGKHFPDSAQEYKDVSSVVLLKKVANILDENAYIIENIDATIIAQKPKLAPYIEKMKEVICSTLKISSNQLNIKATTEEGLGFTGNESGISAHSVCLLNSVRDAFYVSRDMKDCTACDGCRGKG